MADIISELQTIKNGVYGKDIRMAIHDALNKINEEGGSGGGTGVTNVATLSAYGFVSGVIESATNPNEGGE